MQILIVTEQVQQKEFMVKIAVRIRRELDMIFE